VVFGGLSSRFIRAKADEHASISSVPLVCSSGLADTVFVCAKRGGSHRANGGMFAFVPTPMSTI
jgi:hypothetical protein